MQFFVVFALVGALCIGSSHAEVVRTANTAGAAEVVRQSQGISNANPIRRVVSLLEDMAQKVEAQVEKDSTLHKDFLCTCTTGQADMENNVAANRAKIPALESDLQESSSALAKLKETLKSGRASLDASTKALAEATGLRQAAHQAFESESNEKKEFIASLAKAVSALKGGAAASFVQTQSALTATLRRASTADTQMTEYDRESLTAFLSTGEAAADHDTPEIVGILSNMQADYEKTLKAITAAEVQAVSVFKGLQAAKNQEARSLQTGITKQSVRAGTLSVNIGNLKHDKKNADEEMAVDQKMLQNLVSECKAAPPAYQARAQLQREELSSIHDTIQILNNDDALDVFKSALPSSPGSLLQVGRSGRLQKRLRNARAAAVIVHDQIQRSDHAELRFLEMALLGQKVDFSKVTKMVDDMLSIMGREQVDDDNKYASCKAEIRKTGSKAKALAQAIDEQEADKNERDGVMETITVDLQLLQGEATQLDKLVTDTTKERQAQNTDFVAGMASNAAAKEILQFAQKRLNEFYNPRPATNGVALAAVDDVNIPMDNSQLFKVLDARGPTVHAISLLSTSSGTTNVIEMLSKLVNEVEVQMTSTQQSEAREQKVYESFISDAAAKRAVYMKSINIKAAAKAEVEITKTTEGRELDSKQKQSKAVKAYGKEMHIQCDWLLQNIEFRRSARAQEMENLKKAKDTLHGASISLVQSHSLLSRGSGRGSHVLMSSSSLAAPNQ